jgi:hypothetical protein
MKHTELKIIAAVSRIVTQVCDQILGDRTTAPLVVALSCQKALLHFKIQSECIYGNAAWIEIQANNQPTWVGSWDPGVHFWVQTQFQEIVDLNILLTPKNLFCAPLLWSYEVPRFYRYQPMGIAEMSTQDPKEIQIFTSINEHIDSLLLELNLEKTLSSSDFPIEPILCSDRQLLDDDQKSFAQFDRALGVYGIPALYEKVFSPADQENSCGCETSCH